MLFASGVPIQPGRSDRYLALAEELQPHLDEYEELNRRYGVIRHAYWLNHPRADFDIGVSVYDIAPEGLELMKTRQWDRSSAYDRWWLDFVNDVNGIHLTEQSAHRAPPEQVFAWGSQPLG